MIQKAVGTRDDSPDPAGHSGGLWWHWLDAAPAFWLVVVGSAYSLLALHPLVPTAKEVPGMAEADRLALPLLVVTLTAGIIRYVCARASEQQSGLPPASRAERRDTE
ncbi:MAG: hypothetical protein K0Q72_5072 [Armatimonadetes bacterium]|jgi:hypothetical protein|nr:hypothetical protein [Armatimonadota bacterium]